MVYFVLMCYGHSISSPLTDFSYKYQPGYKTENNTLTQNTMMLV